MGVIGSTVSHFRILSKLGEGGMGVVYRAEDLRLGRSVALKFLPPAVYAGGSHRERFLLEAKAASSLSHPAICTIYGIEEEEGKPFIVMEYIEGETLREKLSRGPVSPGDVIDWVTQCADGLGAAHAMGIVHRDIKPENLIVRKDGRAQILDFGLAKWRGTASLSTPGGTLGTLAYMSPEQVQGLEVDGRSDIYSLGSVMYELLAGRPPFRTEHDAALLYAIVNTNPPSLDSVSGDPPPALLRLVMRCLARNRDERPQSALEVSASLRAIAGASAGAGSSAETAGEGAGTVKRRGASRFTQMALLVSAVVLLCTAGLGIYFVLRSTGNRMESLAILPLRNASADTTIDYLTDGLTESIISKLSGLSTIRVMSRSSVFHYKGKDVDPQAAGKALGVQGVLVGDVVPRDGFVTISVELLNARDNTEIWGEQFRRKETELFALQDDVSKEIVQSLRLRLTSDEKEGLGKAQTTSAEAYELFLKGRYHWNKRTRADLEESLRLFREAIAKDPGYAAAYAAMASSYDVQVAWAYVEPETGIREAVKYARKALELDDRLGEAHAALAGALESSYDRLGALREYKRAVELNPSDARAFQWYAEELATFRRFDDALVVVRHAAELDPISFVIPAITAVFYGNSRRFDSAIEISQKTVDLDPSVPMGHLALGLAYTRAGRYAQAIPELEKGVSISDSETTMVSWLGCAYALGGMRESALRIDRYLDDLSKRSYVSPYLRALVATGLGEKGRALALLAEGVRNHDGWVSQTYEEIMFDPLRHDPKYTDIVKRLGLLQ